MSFKSERQDLIVEESAQAGLSAQDLRFKKLMAGTKKDPHPEVEALPEELIRLLATLSKEGLSDSRPPPVGARSPAATSGFCQITSCTRSQPLGTSTVR
jgi:hypothetical protein